MSRVLAITNHRNATDEQKRLIQTLHDSGAHITEALWNDLLYEYDGSGAHTVHVSDQHQLLNLCDFDIAYIRADKTIDPDMRTVLIRELSRVGVPTVGTVPYVGIENTGEKADTMHSIQTQYDLSFPQTFFGRANMIAEHFDMIAEKLSTPFVCKPNTLSRGQGVALIHTKEEFVAYVEDIKAQYGKRKAYFLAQKYLQNDGDYRALCIGDSWYVLKRQSTTAGEFRHNVSLGGKTTLATLPEALLDICKKIARDMGHDFLGFDFIEHNNEFYCLEINRCPGMEGASKAHQRDLYKEHAEYILQKSRKH